METNAMDANANFDDLTIIFHDARVVRDWRDRGRRDSAR